MNAGTATETRNCAEGTAPPAQPEGAVPTVAWASRNATGIPGQLELLDQTELPHTIATLRLSTIEAASAAIQRLSVRGAPAIGVAAAYALVLAAQDRLGESPEAFRAGLAEDAAKLERSRPTAVNLSWAIARSLATVQELTEPAAAAARLLSEARAIHAEDETACAAMGAHALELVRENGRYLTHCNTGRLATAGIGTAFGVFVTAQHVGLDPFVYVGEVRPLLQGSRLTAFEMGERGIAGRLLPDSAAGALLRSEDIAAVFVGADRIAANGDTANKIGTYALAELARANRVPFYVVAPTSTIDATLADGSLIPIEQRASDEITGFRGQPVAPAGTPVWNPAFDVTPAALITAIVTEAGVFRPPFDL